MKVRRQSMPMSDERICGTCDYWLPSNDAKAKKPGREGECRRRAPVLLHPGDRGRWPKVTRDQICGEWEWGWSS